MIQSLQTVNTNGVHRNKIETKFDEYEHFIQKKSQLENQSGFKPLWIPDWLFDFQKYLTEWTILQGRGGLFADCGMGKTLMQLVYAQNVVQYTNKPSLILTPIAVSHQTVLEAEKFGIECERSINGKFKKKIVITNYERLHYFDPNDFSGVICDESSILKNFDGVTKHAVTEFMKKIPFRLLATATAAPNDFMELGTSSEALGFIGYIDMQRMFFKNDKGNLSNGRMYGKKLEWRFRGHAEKKFWQWVSSWARAIRKPSEYGFDDGKFILPKLIENEHWVETTPPDGCLFNLPVTGNREQIAEQKRTMKWRCEKAAELVLARPNEPSLSWVNFDKEGDLLERMIDGSVQISGKDKTEAKEEKFIAFINGQIKKLITKHKIGAWGLNFQHCAHTTNFPNHSYERYYQGVRRLWRYGQKNDVIVDNVTTEGLRFIMDNVNRKAQQADKMFSSLVAEMTNALQIKRTNNYNKAMEFPSWL